MITLAPGDVHIWHVNPSCLVDAAVLRGFESLMSSDERARYERFVFPVHRHGHLVAKALVRTTLSRYVAVEPRDWAFAAGANGKPRIAHPAGASAIQFNLSHTIGLAAIAISCVDEVGLDVERASDTFAGLDIARRYFAPVEANALEALPPEQRGRRFLEYWTLKESYIKATGEGLTAKLHTFWFSTTDPPLITFRHDVAGDPSEWQFARIDLGAEHVAALAVRTRRGPSRISIHTAFR